MVELFKIAVGHLPDFEQLTKGTAQNCCCPNNESGLRELVTWLLTAPRLCALFAGSALAYVSTRVQTTSSERG